MRSLIKSRPQFNWPKSLSRIFRLALLLVVFGWLVLVFWREQQSLIRQWREKWSDSWGGWMSPATQPGFNQPVLSASNSGQILEALNLLRAQNQVARLATPAALQAAAKDLAKLTAGAVAANQDLSETDVQEILSKARVTSTYARVTSSTQVGEFTLSELLQVWQQNSEVDAGVLDASASAIGLGLFDLPDQGVVAVRLLVWPAPVRPSSQPLPTTSALITKAPSSDARALPYISDTDVLTALNQYRADHQVHQLVEHPALCNYAAKRVKDLVAVGGLDNHDGFRRDFADPSQPPDLLADYPGRTIGENLASQYCRNMTTGDSFIAQTATSLIEWCFDSSTKGHREAQLNPAYNNVCARHENGLFVVIFGD